MLSRSLLLVCLVRLLRLCCLPVSQADETDPVAVSSADALIGAWRLVSVETIRPNGEVIYPFYGRHPEGLIVYDRSGWMSVQIVSDPKPAVSESQFARIISGSNSCGERSAAIDGYYAYCGTWTVDPGTSTVTHHVKQALYPGERGRGVAPPLHRGWRPPYARQ